MKDKKFLPLWVWLLGAIGFVVLTEVFDAPILMLPAFVCVILMIIASIHNKRLKIRQAGGREAIKQANIDKMKAGVNEVLLKYQQEIQEPYDRQAAALMQKLRDDGFTVSGSHYCADRPVKKPEPFGEKGLTVTKTTVLLYTKAFFIDTVHRKVAFAWYGDTPEIRYFNYGDILSCELLYDGVKETNKTRIVTGSNGQYFGNTLSSSTNFVKGLGIKLMLRDPVNPTFVMPLINGKMMDTDQIAVNCTRFAQKVRDSVNVIINS